MGRKENAVESYFVTEATALRAEVRKVTYQGRTGAPDRWAFFPKGRVLIVECKAPDGGKPRPDQVSEMKVLRLCGQYVAVVSSREQVDDVLRDFFTMDLREFNRHWPLER